MCFRPAELSKPVPCPSCGKKIPTMAGVRQKKCPFCKTELPEPTINCPMCGHANNAESKVCVNCGFNGKPGSSKVNKQSAI